MSLEEVQTRYRNNIKLMNGVNQKLSYAKRVRAEGQAVLELLASSQGAPMYRGVGKAFMMCEAADIETRAQSAMKEAQEDSEKFAKQQVYLKGEIERNQKELQRIMSQK